MQLGYTGEAEWCPEAAAEAMPSSRGDTWAAEHARTGGAKSPRRGQRISLNRMRLTVDFRGYILDAGSARVLALGPALPRSVNEKRTLALTN